MAELFMEIYHLLEQLDSLVNIINSFSLLLFIYEYPSLSDISGMLSHALCPETGGVGLKDSPTLDIYINRTGMGNVRSCNG